MLAVGFYFGPEVTGSYETGSRREWLITNGLGGFAMGTAIGANVRRYHGLLIAALHPPVDRRLLLSKIDVEAEYRGHTFLLGTNRYTGGIHPRGFEYLTCFSLDPFPRFTYAFGGCLFEVEVFMPYGRNAVAWTARVLEAADAVKLRLIPLVNARDYHGDIRANDWPFAQEAEERATGLRAYPGAPVLRLAATAGVYRPEGAWYFGMEYDAEKRRGLPSTEDHYRPGTFEVVLGPGEHVSIWAEAGVEAGTTAAADEPVKLVHAERRALLARHDDLLKRAERFLPVRELPEARALVLAADSFIVGAGGRTSIIAGYPWFSDWGRDAMIALPGLTLVTGRPEDGREVLRRFAENRRDGLLPNLFTDDGGAAYNTIDASLWFLQAAYEYWRYTKDADFARKTLLPAGADIIEAYARGTLFGIHVDEDGLVAGGERGLQLTWMDAKVGNWVVTPREGKPVEVNALWYNGLMAMAEMARAVAPGRTSRWDELAAAAKESFQELFWYEKGGYLHDLIDPRGKPSAQLRPNQILAVSLPFPLLDGAKAQKVVRAVLEWLYVPYGLRSLAPNDPAYTGRYLGDQTARDAAYHQGTAWGWLLGPLVSAYRRAFGWGEEAGRVVEGLLRPAWAGLFEAGVGQVSEIFEGDLPFTPRGTPAQAWSVSELLRVMAEDGLRGAPPKP